MNLNIAIVGRPNVGKSTLFNRLCGLKSAIVDPTPGVTRDRRYGDARLSDLRFTAVDTAGFDDVIKNSTAEGMQRQTQEALKNADLALFLIDSREGLTTLDHVCAAALRRVGCPVIPVANKCEGIKGELGFYEIYGLGFGDPVAISAEHGEGMADLYQAINGHFKNSGCTFSAGSNLKGNQDVTKLRVAIVGRPNVGKSTLVNCFIGEERVITGPEPGLTRDAIPVAWERGDGYIELYDTAGLRRKARINEKLEKLSVAETLRAVRFAEVVILVMDAENLADRQDFVIAKHVLDEGRAMVIAINKCDLIGGNSPATDVLEERLKRSLPQLKGVRVARISAISGSGIDHLLKSMIKSYEIWNRRIATGPLNRWLSKMVEEHPPPLMSGRRVKLRYITQVKARPPSFLIFTTRPGAVTDSYTRYLENGLRERFDLYGTPIRITFRQGDNPYIDKNS